MARSESAGRGAPSALRLADEAHAGAVARTSPRSHLVLVLASLPVSLAVALASEAPLSGALTGGPLLAAYGVSVLLTSTLLAVAAAASADATLSARPLRETLDLLRSRPFTNALGESAALMVGLYVLAVLGGLTDSASVAAVTALGALVTTRNALSVTYSEHYLRRVLRPSARALYEARAETRTRRVRLLRRVTLTRSVGAEHVLRLPILSAAAVLYLAPTVWNLLLSLLGVDPSTHSLAFSAPALSLVVVAASLFARWHLRGGLAAVTRLGVGRPMTSGETPSRPLASD